MYTRNIITCGSILISGYYLTLKKFLIYRVVSNVNNSIRLWEINW